MRWIFIIAFCFFSFAVFADVYRYVDSKGVVTYTDQPAHKAEAVNLPAANIAVQAKESEEVKAATKEDSETKEDAEKSSKKSHKNVNYSDFKIISPLNQTTFQNATAITVNVVVYPALQSGDSIQFYLDKTAVSPPIRATSYTIPKVQHNAEILTRGSHTVSANLLNANGEVIKETPAVTIFIHYANISSTPQHAS